jgi:hypothetical protein
MFVLWPLVVRALYTWMMMKSSIGCLLAVALVASVGCGGGKPKINAAKMHNVHKVAIVGVCTTRSFSGVAGTSTMFDAEWGDSVLPHEATGFETALPGAWRGVEVMPISAVIKNELPKGSGSHLCFGSLDPLDAKNKPDLALMKQLAAALNVDAVVAVWSAPAVKSGSSKAHMYTGLGASAVGYVVDKDGELIVTASLKGVDSAEIENLFSVGLVSTDIRKVAPQEYQLLGTSFGEAMAKKLGTGLSGS